MTARKIKRPEGKDPERLRERIAVLEKSLAGSFAMITGLQQSEEMFRLLVTHMPDVAWTTDSEGGTVYISPRVYDLSGFTAEECRDAKQGPWFSRVHPDDRRQAEDAYRAMFAHGSMMDTAYRIQHKDGRWIWVHHRATVGTTKEGQRHARGVIRDINDAKEAHEALRRSVEKYRDLFEHANDAIFIVDSAFRYVDVNTRATELFGYTKEEFLSMGIFDVIPADQVPRSIKELRQLEGRGKYEKFRGKMRSKDGRWRDIEVNSSAIIEDGKVIGSRDIVRDITEQVAAQNAVLASETLLRSVIDAAPFGAHLYELQSNDRLVFIGANRAADRILGVDNRQFIGKTIEEAFPLLQQTDIPEAYRTTAKHGKPFEREHVVYEHGRIRGIFEAMTAQIGNGRMVAFFRDITERKEIEEKLKEEKNRSAAIIAAIGDGISIQDRDYRILYQNDVHKRLVGDHKGELCYVAYEQQERPCAECPVASAFADGKVHMTERTAMIQGEARSFEISASPLRDASGSIVAGIEVVREITERKRTENSLREERNFVSAIVDTVEALVLVLDVQGQVVRFNRACERYTGYTFAEVEGRHVWDLLIPPEQVEEVKGVFTQLKSGSFPNRHVNHWLTKSGERRLISWSNTVMIDADGAVQYVVPTGIDITEQERAQAEVLRSGERYRSIFNNASVSLWEEDLSQVMNAIDGLRAGGVMDFRRYFEGRPDEVFRIASLARILDVNDFTLKLYGASSKEELMQSLQQFLTPESVAETRELMIALAEGRARYQAETKNRTIDGRLLDILITISIPSETSAFSNCLVSIMDITAHKLAEAEGRKLQAQLLQSQKMEAIGLLAGGIAHDFNNILSAIMGYSSIIQMKMQPDDPMHSHVEQILAASKRAAALTQSLLAFSRKQIVNPLPLEVSESIRRIESLLRRLIGEDIEFVTHYHPDPLIVHADPTQVEQVIINLATNARDAMPRGGTLTLSTDAAAIDDAFIQEHGYGELGRYARVQFRDSGMGMDEETRSHIFEPFFTTKELGKGTGLGLATVYGIVKQSNGYILCESTPGAGTMFTIYLPLSDAPRLAEDRDALRTVRGGTEMVLIAEDDEVARTLFQAVLEEQGYRVITAENGAEAIERFRERADEVQLLVLDVIMPKRNGREVYEEVQRIRPDVKALFTSGYTADIISAKGILDPSTTLITKPVAPEDLLRTVRAVLDGESPSR